MLLLAVVLAACPGGRGDPVVDAGALELAQLHEEMSQVASAQRTADTALGASVRAVRELDAIVGALRNLEKVDAARGTWQGVTDAFAAAHPETLRDLLVELAFAVDRARGSLREARGHLEGDWEQRYLDAEDEVLAAVRSYAEAADRFGQAINAHWPTYGDLHARTATFVEQAWFYRNSREAADAYELAVQPLLQALADAQAAVAAARDERDDAGTEVNVAIAAAREVWAARPDAAA